MPRSLLILLPIALATASCDPDGPTTLSVSRDPIDSAEIDLEVKALGKQLKQELLAALEDGGPGEAISVCRDKAPAVSAAHSERTGWEIRRTALRWRNPANAPDDWEREQLELFAEQLAAGGNPAGLTAFEVIDNEARFARAIPTVAECLLCHGSAIAPETKAALDSLYPEDKATGFALGDLRGIFSVKVPLK